MKKDQCFELGYITKSHGLNGEVVIVMDVDDPSIYGELESVFVEQKQTLVPFFIESLSPQTGKKFLCAFEDIESKDDTETLIGSKLYLPETFLPNLTGKQFYFHEVIGFVVTDQSNNEIGLVKEFVSAGPQDIAVVMQDDVEILIPITDDTVIGVERKNKKLQLEIPEGLIEVYTQPSDQDED